MRVIILLSLCLISGASQELWSAGTPIGLLVSISVPGGGAFGAGHESRTLSFREPQAHFHVLISNNYTNEIRLWKEDCSWGYGTLSFQASDTAGNHWTARKQPRSWRRNYPRWWLLKPSETLIIDVHFGDSKSWDGFRRPAKDTALKLNLTAVFEIGFDEQVKEHQIWNGRIVSAPVEVTFYD